MWTNKEQTEEHIRAEAVLRRMKEIERQYEQERRKVVKTTEFGGIRTEYVKQKNKVQ